MRAFSNKYRLNIFEWSLFDCDHRARNPNLQVAITYAWQECNQHWFTSEKCLRMCREKIKWSISRKVIGLEAKYPRNVVKMKEEMTAFFLNGLQ